MKTRLLAGLVGVGVMFVPLASGASAKKKQSPKMSDDMARAIAFERAKDRADARQARLEARHPSVTYTNPNAERMEESQTPGRQVKDPGEPAWKRDKRQ